MAKEPPHQVTFEAGLILTGDFSESNPHPRTHAIIVGLCPNHLALGANGSRSTREIDAKLHVLSEIEEQLRVKVETHG
jgi:hypothetical protein